MAVVVVRDRRTGVRGHGPGNVQTRRRSRRHRRRDRYARRLAGHIRHRHRDRLVRRLHPRARAARRPHHHHVVVARVGVRRRLEVRRRSERQGASRGGERELRPIRAALDRVARHAVVRVAVRSRHRTHRGLVLRRAERRRRGERRRRVPEPLPRTSRHVRGGVGARGRCRSSPPSTTPAARPVTVRVKETLSSAPEGAPAPASHRSSPSPASGPPSRRSSSNVTVSAPRSPERSGRPGDDRELRHPCRPGSRSPSRRRVAVRSCRRAGHRALNVSGEVNDGNRAVTVSRWAGHAAAPGGEDEVSSGPPSAPGSSPPAWRSRRRQTVTQFIHQVSARNRSHSCPTARRYRYRRASPCPRREPLRHRAGHPRSKGAPGLSPRFRSSSRSAARTHRREAWSESCRRISCVSAVVEHPGGKRGQ